MKQSVEFVISINVFKCIDTLILQLRSLKEHIHEPYVVILNCDDSFFAILQNHTFEENVHINPERITKRRLHGSLTKGILSNMNYALTHYDFNFFIILSGRTIFYKNLNKERLEKIIPTFQRMGPPPNDEWHWKTFKTTQLATHYMSKGYLLHASPHEGLVFSSPASKTIALFLKANKAIEDELINFDWCVEEFALQTIAANESDGYMYIGNGVNEHYDANAEHLYTRKIDFLS